MVKYSFIVPVYNTSKYLNKCLDSIINQTYKDYEIIIVNDGSTDNSLDIIKKYKEKNKNIKVINQDNQGNSIAKNIGVDKSNGKYILFVDSDDYIETHLLEEIDKKIENVQVIKYQAQVEYEDGRVIKVHNEENINTMSGFLAFKEISKHYYVDTPWGYAFDSQFYKDNKFRFEKNKYHEDYGLIPYIIYKANSVKSINYVGYHYIQRYGSIMNDNNYSKTIKKAFDMLELYKNLLKVSNNECVKKNKNDYFLSYITYSAITKARTLKGKEKKEFVNELKKIGVHKYVLEDTFIRKIKKLVIKIKIKMYLKIFK